MSTNTNFCLTLFLLFASSSSFFSSFLCVAGIFANNNNNTHQETDLNLSQNENDVVDVNEEAGLLLNYGDKRTLTLDAGTGLGLGGFGVLPANGIKLENAVIKSRVDILSEVFKKNIEKIKTKHKKLDIVFLIDGSSSVGKNNFKSELKFVKKLLSDFTVSYDYTRIAVVSFSSQHRIIRHVDQISEPSKINDKCLLLNYELEKIEFLGGGTHTYGALTEAKDILYHARFGSKKLIFLITDGFSNGQNPVPLAEQIKKDFNITIFTIGIQNGNYGELYSIASTPGELHSYLLDSFGQFESLARKALHTDYKVGETISVSNQTLCGVLCTEKEEFCCDKNAHCSCETSSGHYL